MVAAASRKEITDGLFWEWMQLGDDLDKGVANVFAGEVVGWELMVGALEAKRKQRYDDFNKAVKKFKERTLDDEMEDMETAYEERQRNVARLRTRRAGLRTPGGVRQCLVGRS